MSNQNPSLLTAAPVSVQTAILSAGEVARHGYARVFRTEQARAIETTDKQTVNIRTVLGLNSREIVVRTNDGNEKTVPLSTIQFVHVASSLAEHLRQP